MLALALAGIVLIANAAFAWRNAQAVAAAESWVAHTQEERFELDELFSAVQGAESGMRGFLITGRDAYLEPFRSAVAEVDQHHAAVMSLVAAEPAQQKDLLEVRRLIDAKLAHLKRTIDLHRGDSERGPEAARREVLSGRGKQIMDELRRVLDRMEDREAALLAARRQEAATSLRMAMGNTVASLVVGLLLVVVVVVVVRRGIASQQRSAEVLFAEREHLRATLTSIRDAVIVTDAAGRVTMMNGPARALTGWGDEGVGRPLDEVFPVIDEQTRLPVADLLEDVLRESRVMGPADHAMLVARDGTEVPIDDSGALIRGADGAVVGVVIVSRDVREQRRAEVALRESEERFRLLVEGVTGYAIFMLAPDGTVMTWNAGAEHLDGYRAEEIVGEPFGRFYPEEEIQAGTPQKLLETASREGRVEAEVRRVRKDGSRFRASVLITAVRDAGGDLRGFATLVRDVTERRRAGDALRAALADAEEKSRLLEALMEHIPVGITIADVHHIRMVSRYGRELTGKPREQLEGLPVEAHAQRWGIYAADGVTSARDEDLPLTRAAQKGEVVRDEEWVLRTPAGARVPILCDAGPIRDASGAIVGGIIAWRDISERKETERLRESEERFRALAEASAELLYRVSPDWSEIRQLKSRGSLADMGENSRTWLQDHIPAEDWPRFRAAVDEAIRTGSVFELEHRIRHADGTEGWSLSRAAPLKNARGEIIEWFGAAGDVTGRKRAELSLAKANERLRDADRRKNEFLAVLSHELRNPLAPIRNSVHVLERAAPGSPQAKRALAVIDRQVSHLARLIDDLLDVTRISRGKIRLQRERLALRELVRRTAEDHRGLFAQRDVALEVKAGDSPLHVDGDGTRLAQVVGNLLGNAAKFTPRGGHVQVSLAPQDGSAIVRVEDDGAGIAPALLVRLFEPFMQADQTIDRSMGGLGLGLALVKGLVELHGGDVSAHSEGSGKGAHFVVRLPLADAGELSAEADRGPAEARTARRVLVIEDNVDAAVSLKEALELDGHAVEVASDGHEGLKMARSFRPDVVLCDIGLPGIDGYEIAGRMRADPELRSLRLVALSGYALPEDVDRSKAAGFDRHVAKPVDIATLERELAEP